MRLHRSRVPAGEPAGDSEPTPTLQVSEFPVNRVHTPAPPTQSPFRPHAPNLEPQGAMPGHQGAAAIPWSPPSSRLRVQGP